MPPDPASANPASNDLASNDLASTDLASAKELLADPPAELRAYIRDGRIVMLPAKRTRRRQLLDRVAQAFEPGRRYQEPVVDQILKRLFDDHCALRRYLVEEDFMSRTSDGQYWRSGGAVDFRVATSHGAGTPDAGPSVGGAGVDAGARVLDAGPSVGGAGVDAGARVLDAGPSVGGAGTADAGTLDGGAVHA